MHNETSTARFIARFVLFSVVLALLMAAIELGAATSGVVFGTITLEDGPPLEGVEVRLISGSITADDAVTDAQGNYSLESGPGIHRVLFIGMPDPYVQEVYFTEIGGGTEVNFTIKAQKLFLPSLLKN